MDVESGAEHADGDWMGRLTRLGGRLSLVSQWRVWLLSFVLLASGAAVWNGTARGADVLVAQDLSIPWWLIGLAALAAESMVVHIHFRSESGSFSFFELPMLLGLLFVDPTLFLPAIVAGTFLALAFVRRQRPVKVAFNVGNQALRVAVAWWLFQSLIGEGEALQPLGWLAIGVATLSTSVLEVLMIAVVITVTEQRFDAASVRKMIVFGLLVAAANTAQGLVMALLLIAEPWSLLLLGFSTFVLFVAYRAYVAERDQRERVEFLYASTRALQNAEEHETATSTLLEEAATMFRAGAVELHLFGEDADDPGKILIWVDSAVEVEVMSSVGRRESLRVAAHAQPAVIVGPESPVLVKYVAARGYEDALVGALMSGDKPNGLLVAANRLGNVSTFTDEDLQLFATLVQHAAVALENDQLEQALTQLRLLERELAHQASHDGLTGLANRALLNRRLSDQIESGHDDLALLYIDLDDFKLVNDTQGHAAGDKVLVEAARRLKATIRPVDTAARLGGDEFAILLVENPEPRRFAERLLQHLNKPYTIDGETVLVGASVGLALAESDVAPAALVSRADAAMYAAKDKGKATLAIFEKSMSETVTARSTLRSQLRTAVAERQFRVLYQPVVELGRERIVGAEALVRWVSPDGLLLPEGFIGEAERSGLIVPIDSYVFSQVLDDLRDFQVDNGEQIWVSSNVSMRTLQDPNLLQRIVETIDRAEVDPSLIVLEVTETALMHEPELAAEQLSRLRAYGIRIALDDFGTGYSSLSYLRRFSVDILKIAQPFVGDLCGGDETFVRAIVELGHTLGLDVLAEGIESAEALARLEALGCEMGQGFYFARPHSAEDLVSTLRRASSSGGATAAVTN